jgi:hypothetical protein
MLMFLLTVSTLFSFLLIIHAASISEERFGAALFMSVLGLFNIVVIAFLTNMVSS